MTTDNNLCTFPFVYEHHRYFTCTNLTRNDIPNGLFWCPIGAKTYDEEDFKSVGICQGYCPKSKEEDMIDLVLLTYSY